jgi:hypothetical protein
MLTAEDIFGGLCSKPIEVMPPGTTKTVWLRYPTFAEWYEIACEHRKAADSAPSADLIARTVALCVAGPDGGRRMTDAEASMLLTAKPQPVAWLYKKCWDTVLADDDSSVMEAAKK